MRIVASFLFSLWEKQPPCCEDTQAVLVRGPCDKELRPLADSQHQLASQYE